MSGIDLSFVSGKEKFNYRVCAVIIQNPPVNEKCPVTVHHRAVSV